jgi:hypothetical protein
MTNLSKSLTIENIVIARKHLRRVLGYLEYHNEQKNTRKVETLTVKEILENLEIVESKVKDIKPRGKE